MSTTVILVAASSAIGVGLVVYGIVGPGRAAAKAGPTARPTARTLADVREQLRRRVEPTGAPGWVAPPCPASGSGCEGGSSPPARRFGSPRKGNLPAITSAPPYGLVQYPLAKSA